jgi:hypothetical protein
MRTRKNNYDIITNNGGSGKSRTQKNRTIEECETKLGKCKNDFQELTDNIETIIARKIAEFDRKFVNQTKINENLLSEIQYLRKNVKKQSNKLEEQSNKLGEQSNKLGEQSNKLGEQSNKLEEQSNKLEEQSNKLGEQSNKLGEQSNKLEDKSLEIQQLYNNNKNQSLEIQQLYNNNKIQSLEIRNLQERNQYTDFLTMYFDINRIFKFSKHLPDENYKIVCNQLYEDRIDNNHYINSKNITEPIVSKKIHNFERMLDENMITVLENHYEEFDFVNAIQSFVINMKKYIRKTKEEKIISHIIQEYITEEKIRIQNLKNKNR